MNWTAFWLFLHVSGVVIWVGGMFFAYQCLRPVAAQQLQPPQRLPLWVGVFSRFFPWVWASVAAILVSGLAMLLAVGFAAAPVRSHLMFAVGLAMMGIFAHVFFASFQRLKRGVAEQKWPDAAAALNQIRRLVGLNLVLGFANIAIIFLGRMLP